MAAVDRPDDCDEDDEDDEDGRAGRTRRRLPRARPRRAGAAGNMAGVGAQVCVGPGASHSSSRIMYAYERTLPTMHTYAYY